MSIRGRLIVLALLAITPLMFERLHALEGVRAERTAGAHAQVIDLARRGAEAQEATISEVRAFLQIIADVYARTPFNQNDCDRYLSSLTTNISWIRTVSVAGTNGQIRCATDPRAVGLNMGDRPHFQHAVHDRRFAVSDYFINTSRQIPSIYAAFPIVGEKGAVVGAVMASINLQWMNKIAAKVAEEPGSSVLLVDGDGTVVAASNGISGFIGQRLADHPLVRDILAHNQGSLTATGLDGTRRIFAYVRVPWTAARLAVGLDEAAMNSSVDSEIGVAYLQLAGIGIFVLIVTWFSGEQLIVRPIRSLVRTVARFGHGDLNARANKELWVAEFRPLAAAFDDMAHRLATRDEELLIANQHLEELASLDGLTGLANRRGFDRELERAWQQATDRREPMALIMIDIDHFKLYNDRYGHVAGDTCLRAVGETLSLVTLDKAVLVARYGGEEFALLLPGLDLARASALAEEVRKSIEDLMISHAEAPCGLVTISIGVESLIPAKGEGAADLVQAADTALYAAKRNGRNTVVAQSPALFRMAS